MLDGTQHSFAVVDSDNMQEIDKLRQEALASSLDLLENFPHHILEVIGNGELDR